MALSLPKVQSFESRANHSWNVRTLNVAHKLMKIKNTFKNRRDIVPKWISYTLILGALLYPMVLIIGKDNLFDLILNQIISWTSPDADFIYLLSYLISSLILLIPLIIVLQLVGYYMIKKNRL